MVAMGLGGDEPHSASAFERPERSALHQVFIIIGRGFSTGRSIETSVHPRSRRAELLTMKVTSTGDVSLDVLSELVPDLSPEIDLEVERAQYQFRTLEPPSFVTFLAQCEWWVQLCAAYAALYFAEIAKEAGKETWKHRDKVLESLTSGGATGVKKLAGCIAKLREHMPKRTRINIGIPVPDDRFPSTFELVGVAPEDLEVEIVVFAMHQQAVSSLVESEGLDQERLLGALRFEILDDGSLQVSWTDSNTMERITKILALDPIPFAD
jgi:hypothetical protein